MYPTCREHIDFIDSALQRAMESTIIPLFVDVDGSAVVLGSGTLFSIGDARFIVTAAHVLETASAAKKRIWFGGSDTNSHRLYPSANGLKWYADGEQMEKSDFAIWRLEESDSKRFPGHRFLRLMDISSLEPRANDFFCTVGFPTELTPMIERGAGARHWVQALKLYSLPYDGETEMLGNYEPDSHILVCGQSETMSAFDHEKPFPKQLGGISGGQIWRIRFDVINEKPIVLAALAAVETCVYRSGRIVRGTKWSRVLGVMFNAWPELQPAMKIAMPGVKFLRT